MYQQLEKYTPQQEEIFNLIKSLKVSGLGYRKISFNFLSQKNSDRLSRRYLVPVNSQGQYERSLAQDRSRSSLAYIRGNDKWLREWKIW